VVLPEVIAGEKPYKLKRQTAAGLADAVLHADIARPSRRCAQGKLPPTRGASKAISTPLC
jgi:hypothetical protein